MFDEVNDKSDVNRRITEPYRSDPRYDNPRPNIFGAGDRTLGLFGGKAEIMSIIEPGHPGGAYHSGTYTICDHHGSCCAVLEKSGLRKPRLSSSRWELVEGRASTSSQ